MSISLTNLQSPTLQKFARTATPTGSMDSVQSTEPIKCVGMAVRALFDDTKLWDQHCESCTMIVNDSECQICNHQHYQNSRAQRRQPAQWTQCSLLSPLSAFELLCAPISAMQNCVFIIDNDGQCQFHSQICNHQHCENGRAQRRQPAQWTQCSLLSLLSALEWLCAPFSTIQNCGISIVNHAQ